MSERIKPQIMVQHVEFLQRCLDGNLPALTTLHEICTEIAWLRGDVDVKWQSRALAAEQTLKQRDEEIVDREKIQQEQLKMLLEAEQERDQLKAELQQAREAVKWIDDVGACRKNGNCDGHYICFRHRVKLKAILERIEKEKLSPH